MGVLSDWVFGDFQSLKPNPDEHRIQPIEYSHLDHTAMKQSSLGLSNTVKREFLDAMELVVPWA